METQKQVAVYKQPKKMSTYQLLKNAGYVAVATALTVPYAYAGELDAIGKTASDEIASGKATVITILTGVVVVLAVLAGWRYLKRGINSA